MKKYNYILLDWDGNLAKTLDLWLIACRNAIEARGIYKSDKEISASFGSFMDKMKSWGITDIEAAMEDADQQAKALIPNVELYPDALEVLEELHDKGRRLALVTTSHKDVVSPLLEKYNLSGLFDVVVTHEDVTFHKPHAEPLEKALKLLGGRKDEALMVGDTDKDIGAGKNAEIDSVLFYPPEHSKFYNLEDLQSLEPTYIIDDFKKLIKIVLGQ